MGNESDGKNQPGDSGEIGTAMWSEPEGPACVVAFGVCVATLEEIGASALIEASGPAVMVAAAIAAQRWFLAETPRSRRVWKTLGGAAGGWLGGLGIASMLAAI